MSDPSQSPFLFPFFFIGLWLVITGFLAVVNGWFSLAGNFRARSGPPGQKVTGQVRQMGMVPERRVTHLIISENGLYLYASFLFRFLRPPLLIPWSEVRFIREIKTLWWSTYELEIGQTTTLRVTPRAYGPMQAYVAQWKTPCNACRG